jgi:nucleotide-binding universal stress UspA family protein
MTDTMVAPVVVGADGSPGSRAALRRAMEMAAERKACLHVVCAYNVDPSHGFAPEVGAFANAAGHARKTLGELCAEARSMGIQVEEHAVQGAAGDALVEVARTHGAACIVVGSRGMHGPRRVLGSVPNAVSHHAHCVVLIVRTV